MGIGELYKSFKKVKLLEKSKRCINDFNKSKYWIEGNINTNYGILTGKVNNIIVIDCDFYDKPNDKFNRESSLFIKTFGEDYITKFNTLTQQTPSGGTHLIFRYDDAFSSGLINKVHKIDIKTNGGYIVGSGCRVINKQGEEADYKIINKTIPMKIPNDLKGWLVKHLVVEKKMKKKRTGGAKDPLNAGYIIDLSEREIRVIFDTLPKAYFNNYDSWLIFTTACKELNCFALWDEYSRQGENYNRENNIKVWNGIKKHFEYHTLINLMLNCGVDNAITMLNYHKYKPIIEDFVYPDKLITRKKLGYNFFKQGEDYITKSDTATGKTTSFKHYIKNNNLKFISIVSRMSLGQEQYVSFNEFGVDCAYYRYEKNLENGDNVVITIDSLLKLIDFDFSNYVIFLDEFNSLVEYLITCPNLYKVRTLIFTKLLYILKNAKQIIGTDADIHTNNLKILQRPYTYIINKYKHNKDVKTEEIYSYKIFVNALALEDKFLCCCDSKTQAEILEADLYKKGRTDIVLITSETDEEDYIDLDEHDKVIFSPKIIYGLDSIMERPVYSLYKEHTINPRSMVQQVARCRNIAKLTYCFFKKKFEDCMFLNLQNCKDLIKEREKLALSQFSLMCSREDTDLYLDLFNMITYNEDCYNTNKFVHFKRILNQRGFIDVNNCLKTNKTQDKDTLEVLKYLKEELFTGDEKYVMKRNEILNIPSDRILEFKEYFLNQNKLDHHLNISNYFFKGVSLTQLANTNEFSINKITSVKQKLLFLNEVKSKCDMKEEDITPPKVLNKDSCDLLAHRYDIIFRNRKKEELDLTELDNLQLFIIKIHKHLFGADIVITTRKRIDGVRKTLYTLNSDRLEKEREVYEFRKSKYSVEEEFED